MSPIRTLALAVLIMHCIGQAIAQQPDPPTVEAIPNRVITGLTRPQITDGTTVRDYGTDPIRILPSVDLVIKSEYKAHFLKARRIVLINNQEFISAGAVDAKRITDTLYTLAGDGKYRIEIYATDPGLSFSETDIVIGPAPQPDPGPDPEPIPVPVPNDYNLGKIAYSAAPSDPVLAKQIAALYRYAAKRIVARDAPGATIEVALAEVNTKFAARQCRDAATCEKWADWKRQLDAALIAEQQRRRLFTLQNWYQALDEIATALEAVK